MAQRYRPSEARRKALAEGLRIPEVSNFFPITQYYDGADKLYSQVQKYSTLPDKLDLCYVFCKRYCGFVIERIPEHNYYHANRYQHDRLKHTHQVQLVLDIIEKLADAMDREEAEILKVKEKEGQKRLEAWTKQQQDQQRHGVPRPPQNQLAQSAMDKLNALNGIKPPPQPVIATGVPVAPPTGRTRFRLDLESDEDDDANGEVASAPVKLSSPILPPVLPPPLPQGDSAPGDAPPAYHEVVQRPTYEAAVKKYHQFAYEEPKLPQPVPEQAPKKSLRDLKVFYQQSHRQLQSRGRIKVQPLGTHQGRVSASTNGCTVISALVAATHLNSRPNISNDRIGCIIDRECCPVLREIRKKLGLGGHALIIPSDVHDHLVDEKILHQEKFAGAAGGNILDPEHYGEFLKILIDAKGKASATFFYREHVISIVKCIDANGTSCYDWVDSLPGPSGEGTRTRCADGEALRTQLQWYATSKLRPEHDAPWDENMADLDPRVFQGFIWADPVAQ